MLPFSTIHSVQYYLIFTIVFLVAQRFVAQYGCMRLSIGEAVRKILADLPTSDLAEQILAHIKLGETVPDELCVLALERVLLDVHCTTRG